MEQEVALRQESQLRIGVQMVSIGSESSGEEQRPEAVSGLCAPTKPLPMQISPAPYRSA